jgi:hypothetical protein
MNEIGRKDFVRRFKARLVAIAGAKFSDGSSVADYADMAVQPYIESAHLRSEGPEACADTCVCGWEPDHE